MLSSSSSEDHPEPRALSSSSNASLPAGIHVNNSWTGFSWLFIEADPACGPGLYELTGFAVALSLPPSAGVTAADVNVTVALLRVDSATGLPMSTVGTAVSVVSLVNSPLWATLSAPFTLDISNGERAFAIAFSASGVSGIGAFGWVAEL